MAASSERSRRRVIGIDFSGARDAGNRIWIAEARLAASGLRIDSCRRAASLPGSGVAPDRCLPALVDFIAGHRDAVVGCDFPFSLPRHLVPDGDWRRFIGELPVRFDDAGSFRSHCQDATLRRTAGRRKEERRATDCDAATPWCAWNLRLVRQTFCGIGQLLHPLVHDGRGVVLPMQRPDASKPWLIETCPASLLKRLGLYRRYGGQRSYKRDADSRRRLIATLIAAGLVQRPPAGIVRQLVDDRRGDGLDSVLAAIAAFECLRNGRLGGRPTTIELVEGRVYS